MLSSAGIVVTVYLTGSLYPLLLLIICAIVPSFMQASLAIANSFVGSLAAVAAFSVVGCYFGGGSGIHCTCVHWR